MSTRPAVPALLAFLLAACGGNVVVDSQSSSSRPEPDPDTRPRDPPTDPDPDQPDCASPQVELPAGPTPTGPPCDCPSVTGVSLETDCGALELPARFYPPEVSTYCSTDLPLGVHNDCKEDSNTFIGACAGPNTTPCIQIDRVMDDGVETLGGAFFDGEEVWALEEIELQIDFSSGEARIAGTFQSTATRDGEKRLIGGRFDVCRTGVSCPI